ncbi:MAG: SCO family protein [Burkholderiaceae bacterium]|nr:MAG: SCO family protein [Burkholderiaceae bacterium]
MRPIFSLLSAWLLCIALAACDSKPTFNNVDITGAPYGKDFALTDHTGTPRTLADFKGKVVVLFFGYTHCPDVCPTDMAEWAAALQKLGADAARVQVLFVTFDPERDTPALLARYVPSFNPTFLGLYGDLATTQKTAKDFNVYYEKVPGKTPQDYTMNHSAGSYVFDPTGQLRLFVRHGQGIDALAHDLRELL